jgi:hypothetical protein
MIDVVKQVNGWRAGFYHFTCLQAQG